ncbi:MAG: hypothetical protein N2746_00310 [Deltaproteobacteria bacterium]|nr:hypothetical protein [Deltaproteobacteria bacterium]
MKKIIIFAVVLLCIGVYAFAEEKKSNKPAKSVKTGIKFEVIPAENTIAFIDGKKIGEITKIDVVPVKPGRHTIKLVHNKDEVEVDVVVVKNQILNFKYAFEDSGKGIGGFGSEEKEEDRTDKTEKGDKKEEKDEGGELNEEIEHLGSGSVGTR